MSILNKQPDGSFVPSVVQEQRITDHTTRHRILVAIANYGNGHADYLERLVREYQSMSFDVHIVVLSNVQKKIPEGCELIVGLPTENPWSLPFAHKQVFADRLADYDLFIYTEDDHLITENNIRAFVTICGALPSDEIAGFLQYEIDNNGRKTYPQFHAHFHWDPRSVCRRGQFTLAFFTNEHAACAILTRQQLQSAIESGGFLVRPHEGKYGLAESAATDPYTQCGFRKMICISHLEDISVHHLPNKYVDKSITEDDFSRYITGLLNCSDGQRVSDPVFNTTTNVLHQNYSKSYYESVNRELTSLIPDSCTKVLSIGCGWGALEEWLCRSGKQVAALPLDRAIAACAEARGVKVIGPELETAFRQIEHDRFDCIVLSNILHLQRRPGQLILRLAEVLSEAGVVVACMPNINATRINWRALRSRQAATFRKCYEQSAVHVTSRSQLCTWFAEGGLDICALKGLVPKHATAVDKMMLGALRPILASDLYIVGKKRQNISVGSTV
jgi:2-polyprenyl-3-methyl-5-hydroxy-6-metoxy-1,4-benzoquinol methylase